jgi:NAD-dependent dihydropyrimidine dehydrogenase PreA subunit
MHRIGPATNPGGRPRRDTFLYRTAVFAGGAVRELSPTREDQRMTYVITLACVGVKDASCVDVCPVDCIHPAEGEPDFESVDMLYINPDECIDCGACEPACPVSAIFEESAVPAQWREYIQINADYYKNE